MTPVGVTIISPAYEKVGQEAIRRFKEKTGLNTIVHQTEDGEAGFMAKLNLDHIVGRRPFVFFDSDLWLLDNPEIHFGGEAIQACHDSAAFNPHAFPHTDCERFDMEKTHYINSGLIVGDFRHQKHREWFRESRRLQKASKRKRAVRPVDVTDQIWLNLAKHNIGLPWYRLPSAYNFYLYEAFWGQQAFIPRHIIGLHGAGIKAKDKFRRLKEQAKVFEHPVCPLHTETAAFEVSRMLELR